MPRTPFFPGPRRRSAARRPSTRTRRLATGWDSTAPPRRASRDSPQLSPRAISGEFGRDAKHITFAQVVEEKVFVMNLSYDTTVSNGVECRRRLLDARRGAAFSFLIVQFRANSARIRKTRALLRPTSSRSSARASATWRAWTCSRAARTSARSARPSSSSRTPPVQSCVETIKDEFFKDVSSTSVKRRPT